jgi:hypothetical protein
MQHSDAAFHGKKGNRTIEFCSAEKFNQLIFGIGLRRELSVDAVKQDYIKNT